MTPLVKALLGKKKSGANDSEVTYSSVVSTGYNYIYTFSDVPIGEPASDRRILVFAHAARGSIDSNTRVVDKCRINGVDIPKSSMPHTGNSNVSIGVRVFEGLVTSDSIADITIEMDSSGMGCDPFAISVVALYGDWVFVDGYSLKQDGSTDPYDTLSPTKEAVMICTGLWENTGGEIVGIQTDYDSSADSRQYLVGVEFVASGDNRTVRFEKNTGNSLYIDMKQSATTIGMWEKQ